jgi:formyltetrahydrofolate deformylase
VVSTPLAVRPIVTAFRIPFFHLPVGEGGEARADAEHRLLRLAKRLEVTTIVLARWMLVLSDQCVQAMAADGVDALNLHHGDPAAFPGADPYGQALARGVKGIGACAHYVTPLAVGDAIPSLDQGRIITQEWWPIPAGATKRDLIRVGRRGAATLADAVVAHLQDRILPAGAGTEIL